MGENSAFAIAAGQLGATSVQKETDLRRIANRIHDTNARLAQIANVADSIRDRLYPSPAGELAKGLEAVPGGLIAEINHCLDHTSTLLDLLNGHISEIERAA